MAVLLLKAGTCLGRGASELSQPLVSIIVPVFNSRPEHLEEALASCWAQTYQPVEVIVVDDGSTIASIRAALRALEAQRRENLLILRQGNAGVAAARNAGIRASTGDLILPLDADDVIEAGYLEAAVPLLEDPEVSIVSSRGRYFEGRDGMVDQPDASLPWQLAENSLHNSSLFRRASFERLGGYDESLVLGFEDHEWWVRILLAGGRAIVLEQVLYHYRILPGSRNQGASWSRSALDELRAAMLRNNPERVNRIAEMALTDLDDALDRMHTAQARVSQLEHRLGPIVRLLDRQPRLITAMEWLRRARHGLPHHRKIQLLSPGPSPSRAATLPGGGPRSSSPRHTRSSDRDRTTSGRRREPKSVKDLRRTRPD